MRKFLLFVFFSFSVLSFKAQGTTVFDTTFRRKDLDKINSFAPFLKLQKNCNISQFYVYFRRKGKVSVKVYKTVPGGDKHMNDFFDEAEKGDDVTLEVSQTSCKGMLGQKYKFRIE